MSNTLPVHFFINSSTGFTECSALFPTQGFFYVQTLKLTREKWNEILEFPSSQYDEISDFLNSVLREYKGQEVRGSIELQELVDA